jgi:peptide/nickel transport system ATP-binding protein
VATQPAPPAAATDEVLLRVTDLKKHFPIRRGVFSRVAGYV